MYFTTFPSLTLHLKSFKDENLYDRNLIFSINFGDLNHVFDHRIFDHQPTL